MAGKKIWKKEKGNPRRPGSQRWRPLGGLEALRQANEANLERRRQTASRGILRDGAATTAYV